MYKFKVTMLKRGLVYMNLVGRKVKSRESRRNFQKIESRIRFLSSKSFVYDQSNDKQR